MNITPLRDNIIVEKEQKNLTTASGIILSSTDDADRAKVTAIGRDVNDVQVGDLVIINWNKAQKLDENQYKLSILDVIGVLED